MKKLIVAAFATAMATSLFAGMNNVLVTFHTNGPDKYADGTTVVDGEIYALVWTPTGSTLAGFNADGTAIAPSKVALKAPIAKGGKCPPVQFQLDEEFARVNYPNGTWAVCLLDTRKFAADSTGKILTDAKGDKIVESVGGSMNGYGAVADASTGRMVSAKAAGDVVAAAKAKKPSFKVTDFKVIGDNVFIYAKGNLAGVTFDVDSAATPDMKNAKRETKYATKGAGDDEFIFIAPKDGEKAFYDINK